MKILWFDVETTGLNPDKNDIVQLGFQLEIDGNIVEQGDLRFRPINPDEIEMKALEVCNLTVEEIMGYPDAREQYENFLRILDNHIDKFNRDDKAFPAGYNVGFDYGFLMAMPRKLGDRYGFGSYFNHMLLDPMPIINNLLSVNALEPVPVNRKLETMANMFGIQIEAHDAVSDINATRELYYTLMRRFTFDGKPHWGAASEV